MTVFTVRMHRKFQRTMTHASLALGSLGNSDPGEKRLGVNGKTTTDHDCVIRHFLEFCVIDCFTEI